MTTRKAKAAASAPTEQTAEETTTVAAPEQANPTQADAGTPVPAPESGAPASEDGDSPEPGETPETPAAGEQGDSSGNDQDDEPAALTAILANHTPMTKVLRPLGFTLEPGEERLVVFRDAEHRAACEGHISELRGLFRWDEGEGLHWMAAQ
ncbi:MULTISPECIES: hypothetical protein [Pseudomonas]|uniref:Uncharacterized protein n=1 Tax=Pseudomonas lutea TaxID=243924 RepID=A0A9X8MH06_9PSED|nr:MULTISPECIES: hypothetical protein [Pseudomonas]SER35407.1 hypothetical protein SAMN05216409_11810 [Pseudomonas lutea]